jgi:hypothetical protein
VSTVLHELQLLASDWQPLSPAPLLVPLLLPLLLVLPPLLLPLPLLLVPLLLPLLPPGVGFELLPLLQAGAAAKPATATATSAVARSP